MSEDRPLYDQHPGGWTALLRIGPQWVLTRPRSEVTFLQSKLANGTACPFELDRKIEAVDEGSVPFRSQKRT